MSALDLRPRVSDLIFDVYDRPLHPELFESLARREVSKRDFTLTVCITRTGHVVCWQCPGRYLVEVATTADTPLPNHRALLHQSLRGEKSANVALPRGLTYQTSSQIEQLSDEVYTHVHEEILRDGLKRGLLHTLRPNHRLKLSPLGFITTESWEGNLVLSTFHTFPEERTIVKTQSLIERR